jgi:DNA-directed RNA polymerase specialized sigma24 family protein
MRIIARLAVSPWLLGIARYKWVNHWRRRGRQVTVTDDPDALGDVAALDEADRAGAAISDPSTRAQLDPPALLTKVWMATGKATASAEGGVASKEATRNIWVMPPALTRVIVAAFTGPNGL